jgi:hypothetical protein
MTPADPETRQDLLGLALELHMYCTGSGPDMDVRSVRHAHRFIRMRLTNWHDQGPDTCLFDEAVRILLLAVLEECQRRASTNEVLSSVVAGL